MNRRIITIAALFITLLLIQVLICNHIVLFGVAVPFIFVYFIITLPLDVGQCTLLTLAFLLGLGVDVCSDTAGMNALSCTVVAMMKRPLFFRFVLKDDKSATLSPSVASMGFGQYLRYSVLLVAVYCILVFSVEYFSFCDISEILVKGAASAALTTVLILIVDSLSSAKREKRL